MKAGRPIQKDDALIPLLSPKTYMLGEQLCPSIPLLRSSSSSAMNDESREGLADLSISMASMSDWTDLATAQQPRRSTFHDTATCKTVRSESTFDEASGIYTLHTNLRQKSDQEGELSTIYTSDSTGPTELNCMRLGNTACSESTFDEASGIYTLYSNRLKADNDAELSTIYTNDSIGATELRSKRLGGHQEEHLPPAATSPLVHDTSNPQPAVVVLGISQHDHSRALAARTTAGFWKCLFGCLGKAVLPVVRHGKNQCHSSATSSPFSFDIFALDSSFDIFTLDRVSEQMAACPCLEHDGSNVDDDKQLDRVWI